MNIEFDCKQLIELRERNDIDLNDQLAYEMTLSINHLIALEKNDINFYRSKTLFYTSLKKYIEFLGASPNELIKNIDEIEKHLNIIKVKQLNIIKVKQPKLKTSWLQKFRENWLI